MTEELSKLARPRRGLLGYYDSENVKFSVEGYDFVYFDEDLNLKYVKIKPDSMDIVEIAENKLPSNTGFAAAQIILNVLSRL